MELEKIAEAMYCHLVSPDREVQNVTEWAKREACWKKAKAISISLGSKFKKELVSTAEEAEAKKNARHEQKQENCASAMIQVAEYGIKNWKALLTCRIHLQYLELLCTSAVMQLLRHTGGGLVVGAVLLVAPVQRGPVQIRNVPEDPSHQEVLLYETNQAFYLSFSEGMPRLAELCLEAHRFHKGLVVFLPDRMPLEVTV